MFPCLGSLLPVYSLFHHVGATPNSSVALQQCLGDLTVLFPRLASVALPVMVLGARKRTFDFSDSSVGMYLIVDIPAACSSKLNQPTLAATQVAAW